jgi:membrane protease subunit (stomatin/prohibitin family)
MRADERLVCVHRVPNPIEANILRGLLEQAGLAVTRYGEALSGAYSGVPKVADVRIMVPESDRERAQAVIDDYQQRPADDEGEPWRCARCGEENDSGFEICWSCGHGAAEPAGSRGGT